MSRRRVLFVVPGLAGNGISRFLLDFAKELPTVGVKAEIFTLEPLALADIPHEDLDGGADGSAFTITSGGLPRGRRHRYKLAPMAARLLRAARRSDVVVAAWEIGPAVVAALMAARAARRPSMVMVQSYADTELDHYVEGWAKRATRWSYPRFDLAVFTAEGLRPSAARLGVPDGRVRVIPYGIEVERTRRLAAAEVPDWLPAGPMVVGVGRLAEHKGFDLLIEAHARVLAMGLPHHVVIIGEGERRAELEGLARHWDVTGTVLLPGFLQNPFPVVSRAELFCGPSRFEGWGMMLAEALVLGTPVVASDLAGPVNVLAGGRFGDLIEKESVDALADAMARHLREPARLRGMAAEAAAQPDIFSVASRARAYAPIFEHLAG